MKFFSAISDHESAREAAAHTAAAARAAMGGKIDLAFVFITTHHREDAASIISNLWLELDPQCLLGCSAEGVLGDELEIERSPGLALLVGQLPGVRLHPFHVAAERDWRTVLAHEDDLRLRVGLEPETRALIGFGDPFTTPLHQLLPALDKAMPGIPLIGGMASGAEAAGQSVLFRNDRVYTEGFVGVSLSGPIDVQTVVSQGCRPIGTPLVITRSRENIIEQLGGRPALEVLREIVGAMPEAERELLSHGLFVGRAISEYKDQFGRGDFLIRNLLAVNEPSGEVAAADYMKTGQTVQFHVRDAATASEDLSLLLARLGTSEASGGLLFSCNGRGTRLFSEPCHDISASRRAMPSTPVAGFFAAGELGPVGGRNFVHGHTASFALFKEKSSAPVSSAASGRP